MNKLYCAVLLVVFALFAVAQEKQVIPTSATVSIVPSLPVPASTCKAGTASGGYLVIGHEQKPVAAYCGGGCSDDMKPTVKQVGEYVTDMTAQGYTLTMVPQGNGWIFVSYRCEPSK